MHKGGHCGTLTSAVANNETYVEQNQSSEEEEEEETLFDPKSTNVQITIQNRNHCTSVVSVGPATTIDVGCCITS